MTASKSFEYIFCDILPKLLFSVLIASVTVPFPILLMLVLPNNFLFAAAVVVTSSIFVLVLFKSVACLFITLLIVVALLLIAPVTVPFPILLMSVLPSNLTIVITFLTAVFIFPNADLTLSPDTNSCKLELVV